MTYAEALREGYKNADTKYQRGYISRRVDPGAQVVHTASGNRKGQKYVLLPCFHSTQYCIRQYLTI